MKSQTDKRKRNHWKIAFILGPFALFFLAPAWLPPDTFTFRVWEGVAALRLLPYRPFYPNVHVEKAKEEGDIAHGTPYAVPRPVRWDTDAYGYRNKTTEENPEIVIVGDSFIVGTGLDQNDIFSSQLNRLISARIAAIAPGTIDSFLNDRRFKEKNPKIVVVAKIAEGMRTLPGISPPRQGLAHGLKENLWNLQYESPTLSRISIGLDQIFKAPGLYFMRASVERQLQALIHPDQLPFGRIRSQDGRQLFSEDTTLDVVRDGDLPALPEILANLRSYKDVLAKRQISFVFMPIPSASLIHYESLPTRLQTGRPVFYRRLIDESVQAGIEVVDLEEAFAQLNQSGVNPYQYDDTHWSKDGVATAANLARTKIKLLLQRDFARSQ